MKSLLQSRAFWIAVIQGLSGVATVVFTELHVAGGALIVKTILDILIRIDTTATITRVV